MNVKTRSVSLKYFTLNFTIALAALLVGGGAQAQTIITKADTATLNQAADWGGTAPDSAKIGLFDNTISAANAAALTLGGNVSIGGLRFNYLLNGPVIVASGNTLTLGTSGLDLSLANQNVNLNPSLTLGGAQTWNAGYSRSLTVNGAVANGANTLTIAGLGSLYLNGALGSGAGGLTVNGANSLTAILTGVNTYTGNTTVNAGKLLLDFSVAGGNNLVSASSQLQMGGGTLAVYGKLGVTDAQTFNGLFVNSGGNSVSGVSTLGNTLNVTLGTITRSGSGTVDFGTPGTGFINTTTANNANGILGGWATKGGSDWATGGGNISTPSYTALALTSGGSASANYSLNGALSLSGSLVANSIKTITASGTIALGANNLTFSGISGGFLDTQGDTVTGTGYIGAGTTSEFLVSVASGKTLTISAPLIGNATSGSLTKSGAGKLQLGAANNFTGGVVVNAGQLNIANATALGTGALIIGSTYTAINGRSSIGIDNLVGSDIAIGNAMTLNGDVDYVGSANNLVVNGNVTLGNGNRTVWVDAKTLTLGGVISDGGNGYGIIKGTGTSGTLVLTNANTYTGPTIAYGTGALVVSNSLGSINASSGIFISGSSAKIQLDNTGNNNNDRIKDAGSVTLSLGGELNLTGNTLANTTENFATLGITSGNSTVTVNQGTAGLKATLAASGFSRTANATALVRGSSLGSQATQVGNISFTSTSGLTFVGAGGLPAGVGTTKNLGIIPYLFADSSIGGSGSSFVTYDTTFGSLRKLSTSAEYDTLTTTYATTSANVIDATATGTLTLTAGARDFNSLLLTGAHTLAGAGGGTDNLTIDSGALATTAAVTIGSFNSLIFANEAVITTAGGNLTVNSPISVTSSGGLTKAGSSTLIIGTAPTYTGMTTINQGQITAGLALPGSVTINGGTLQLGNANTAGTVGGSVTLNSGTLAYNRTDSSTPITGVLNVTAGSTVNVNSGTLTLGSANLPAGAMNTFILGGASAGTLVLNGNTTSTTMITAATMTGETVDLKGGNLSWNIGGTLVVNFIVEGGTFTQPLPVSGGPDRFQLATGNQTFIVHSGGTVNIPANSFGIRLGGSGSAGQGGAATVTGTQDGGAVSCYQFSMGGTDTSATKNPSYTLSGGTFNVFSSGSFQLGADTAGLGSSTFALSGSGKLSVSGTLSGSQATAKQILDFSGGTLVAGIVDATKLTSAATPLAQGTLVNNGGTLAPGDTNVSAKLSITGNYSVTSASAALDIDIAGTSQASTTFSDPNKYDFVSISGTAALGGKLIVRTNGAAIGAGPFTILQTANSGLSGTFNNLVNNRVTIANANGASFRVLYNTLATPPTVTLDTYGALSALWTVGNASAPAGSTVTFTDNGSFGAITNWVVSYGDGSPNYTNTTSASASTTHVYAGGSYTATLTVYASDGSTTTVSQAIAATSNPTLAWLGGVSAFWNTNQLNWTNLTAGGTSTLYVDADPIVFNEIGSAQPTVNLNITVVPASVTFSNSATTYTVQGSGKISGSASLVKSLAGTAIILTTNDFSGGTTINAGTLQLGNGASASGTLGGGSITDNGSLVLNPSSASSVTNVILGSGTLSVKNSTVTLTAANSYNGGTTVSNGATVSITADNNLGAGGGGVTLDAGTLQSANSFTLNNRGISLGAGGGTINSASALTVTNAVIGNGALTYSGVGTLTLAGGANTYSGLTTVSGGILQIGNSTATTMGTSGYSLASSATLQFNTTTSQTIASVDGAGATLKNNNTTGVITLNQSAGNHTIGTVSGVNGATVILAGASNSTNTISSALTPAGFLVKVNSGNWTNSTGLNSSANFEVNGGSWTLPAAGGVNFQMNQNNQTFTMHGGQINLFNNYGFRMGNTFGANNATGGGNFTGTQDGGTILYAGGEGFQLGAINAASVNASYTLSGTGIILITNNGFTLGSGTNSSSTTFTLTNSAKLLVSGTIAGAQGAGVIQNFIFGGGTLVANTIDMTKLTTSGVTTGTASTLNNSGFGTLAPGDIGTSGKTTITGSYVQQSGSALAIDIGGTNVANAFQDAAGTYDRLAISQSGSLSGNLNVSLINGFNPAPSQTFTIITATNISGNFTNLDVNQRVICTDSTRSFHVTTNATSVVLDGYQSTGIPAVAVTPASTNILYGNSILLSANATGGGPLAYQWYDKGTNAIVGQTNSTLALTAPGVNASGNYTIIVTNAFGSATGLVVVTVSPAPLGVTANNSSRVYGAANPAFTASYSGFVNGETSTVLGGTLSYGGTSQGAANVGSYTIVPSGLTSANYAIGFANGTLTVTRATITVPANNQSRVYGAANPTFTASYSGFVNGETIAVVSGSPVLTTGADTNSPVGSYAITNTVGSLSATNYAFTLVNGTLTITPAALGITAKNASKGYDGVAFSGGNGVTYAGFVNGETNTVLGGSLSYGGTSQGATNVGSYTIIPSGLTSGNYAIGFANGTLTITPVNLTITAKNATKSYDGVAFSGGNGVTYAGFVNGETNTVLGGSLSYGGTSQGATNVGSYTIAPSGQTSANYAISYTNGTLTINTLGITATADGKTKVYGTTDPALTYQHNPALVGGDSFSGALSRTAGESVGSHAINQGSLSLSANYTLTYVGANLTITPASLTITANNDTKSYDGVAFSGGNGVTYAGFVNGETNTVLGGTLSYGGTSQGATNVGSYTIVPSGLTSGNYAIGFANGALSITPVNLTVTANNDSKAYGQTKTYGAGSTAFTSPGLQNGETIGSVTITATSSPTNGTAATDPLGSYALMPSAAMGGTFNPANYNISYVNGTLTVTQGIPSLTLTSSANPAGYNDSLTFTATLPVSATGTITFKTNSVAYVTNGLSGGTTNFSLSALPRGTNTITAIYNGDTNYLPTTNSLNQIVTNHPPVANAAAYTRNAAVNSFKVLVSDLLTHATDADGDTLSLTSVSATTNGATILVAGGYVMYYNTNAVTDQFTYTVNDAYGGTNSATVTINVDSTPLFGQSQIVGTGGGTATLNFAGIPGYNYSVNRSTNLTDWAVIWTTNAPASGTFQFIDTSAPTPSAYYRLQFNHP